MNNPAILETPRLPILLDNIPILYEDEELGDMGETNLHTYYTEILHTGLGAFFREKRPTLKVYANLNLYYKKRPVHRRTGSKPYVSPDLMVVQTSNPLPEKITSYTIGKDGPSPLLTGEVLSRGTADDIDLDKKLEVYALLGIPEYLLADPTGENLSERLVLKRLQPDRSWKDEQDADGGVTSQLGFRVILEEDGGLRVVEAATGWRYPRPDEANAEARARSLAEENAQAEADARNRAEEKAQAETDARIRAEKKAQAEAEARNRAEESARAEAEARRLAEEKLRLMEAEIARLRSQFPKPDNP